MSFHFRNLANILFPALAPLALVGCLNQALHSHLNLPPHPPSCNIGIAEFGAKAPADYDVAADIWSKYGEATTLPGVRERFREKICQAGGDLLLGDRLYASNAGELRYAHVLVLHHRSPGEPPHPREPLPTECDAREPECYASLYFENAPTFVVEALGNAREPACQVETLGVGASIPRGYVAVGELASLESAPIGSPSDLVELFQPLFCAAGGELLATETKFRPAAGRYSPAALRIASATLLRRDPSAAPKEPGTAR